ncbi:MAG: hypothetical protein O3A30_03800 [Bacteroidetes bacterium]|nr:hypothetical protein [Bacteroidota bacterium]
MIKATIIKKDGVSAALADGLHVLKNTRLYTITYTEAGHTLGMKEIVAVSALDDVTKKAIADGSLSPLGEPSKKNAKGVSKKQDETPQVLDETTVEEEIVKVEAPKEVEQPSELESSTSEVGSDDVNL